MVRHWRTVSQWLIYQSPAYRAIEPNKRHTSAESRVMSSQFLSFLGPPPQAVRPPSLVLSHLPSPTSPGHQSRLWGPRPRVFPSPEHCAPSTCFSLSLPSRVLGPRTSVLIFFSPFTSFTSFTTFTALLTSEAFRTGYSPSLKQRRRSGHQRIRLRVWVPHPRGALQ